MSYVDAVLDRRKNQIIVVERTPTRKRKLVEHNPMYKLYYEDPKGKYTSIYGTSVSLFATSSLQKFKQERAVRKDLKTFEADINPIFRCFEDNYLDKPIPELNIGIFDIEVDFDPDRGYASTEDPFAPITAISLHIGYDDICYTLCIAPKTLSYEDALKELEGIPNTLLCRTETEMLETFLTLINEVDVLSGWNSTDFDIPYMINRIDMIMGKEYSAKFSLHFNDGYKEYAFEPPRKRSYSKFKKTRTTFELSGRVHLDYLELYRKYNSQELHTYRLDYVGEIEVKENKVVYDGTLDQLYKNDFRKFVEYNRQDVMLLVKIDRKRKFIELSNQLAHANAVLLKTTMGSVALIEQAITNYAHERGLVVPCKDRGDYGDDDSEDSEPVVGAYVAVPKSGIHKNIGCIDINSLYPSNIRALNMGPETIIAQIRPSYTDALIAERLARGVKPSEAWEGLFATLEYDHVLNESDDELILDTEVGDTIVTTGKELYAMIFSEGSNMAISANGTLFRTDVEGLIPGLLSKWYSERKIMQAKKDAYTLLKKGLKISSDVIDVYKEWLASNESISFEGFDALEQMDTAAVLCVKHYEAENITIDTFKTWSFLQLDYRDGIFVASNPEQKKKFDLREEFWDQRQLAKKVTLNATYGALLNEYCIYFDQRIGKSVTLGGRTIVKHMSSKVNELITGKYDHTGDGIVYGDTDSVYFSCSYSKSTNANRNAPIETIISYYNQIADLVNDSFPAFMDERFHTGLERGAIIKGGRELVAINGLFITKKRYAVLMVDKENKRLDVDGSPGKIKAMGLDLKRSDTPKVMQKFLEDVLLKVLTEGTREDIIEMIKLFRTEFRSLPSWQKGTPKRINGITDITNRLDKRKNYDPFKENDPGKVHVSGHAQAGYNWNKMLLAHKDKYSLPITDGAKTIVCKLKPNNLKINSIAYPIDQMHLPNWFKELPFDDDAMEEKIIDSKLDNLIGVLKWDLRDAKNDSTFGDFFKF